MFLVAFVIFMMKSTCKKDSAFFNEMFGTFGKFHFIPILCGAILFLIAETLKHGKDRNDRGRNIAGMIIVIIGLCSMIFIYIKTNLPGDWMTATIKKGAYSFLIALEWYYFCYLNILHNFSDFFSELSFIRPMRLCLVCQNTARQGNDFPPEVKCATLIISMNASHIMIPIKTGTPEKRKQ